MENSTVSKTIMILKANLNNICRLCGKDNPFMTSILNEDTNQRNSDVASNNLHRKIMEFVGFVVHSTDKMPQKICYDCLDQLNDFSKFRQMCYQTNLQLRNLLGIQEIQTEVNDILQLNSFAKKAQKRKIDEFIMKFESLKSLKQDDRKLSLHKTKFECNICYLVVNSKKKLEKHLITTHRPSIINYMCKTCSNEFRLREDYRQHMHWHKTNKVPFKCPLCDMKFVSLNLYTRHINSHLSEELISSSILDKQCPKCKGQYITVFLFNIHPCAINTMRCPGCNRKQGTEVEYRRHVPKCSNSYSRYAKIINEKMFSSDENKYENEFNDSNNNSLEQIFSQSHLQSNCTEHLHNLKTENVIIHAQKKSKKLSNNLSENIKRLGNLIETTKKTIALINHDSDIHIKSETENCIYEPDIPKELYYQNENINNDNNNDDNNKHEEYNNQKNEVERKIHDNILYKLNDNKISSGIHIKNEILSQRIPKIPILKLKIKNEIYTLLKSNTRDNIKDKRKNKNHKKVNQSVNKENANDPQQNRNEEQMPFSFLKPKDELMIESTQQKELINCTQSLESLESIPLIHAHHIKYENNTLMHPNTLKRELIDSDDRSLNRINFIQNTNNSIINITNNIAYNKFSNGCDFNMKQEIETDADCKYWEQYNEQSGEQKQVEPKELTESIKTELKEWNGSDEIVNKNNTDLNLKIISVRSCDPNDSEYVSPKKDKETFYESDPQTIYTNIYQDKEYNAHALPIKDEIVQSDDIEEQQNTLNQEMLDQQATSIPNVMNLDELSTEIPDNTEEFDNCINETTDAALQVQLHNQELDVSTQQFEHEGGQTEGNNESEHSNYAIVSPTMRFLDDQNINEIAENNNNANIERELQEDNANNERSFIRVRTDLLPNFTEDN